MKATPMKIEIKRKYADERDIAKDKFLLREYVSSVLGGKSHLRMLKAGWRFASRAEEIKAFGFANSRESSIKKCLDFETK